MLSLAFPKKRATSFLIFGEDGLITEADGFAAVLDAHNLAVSQDGIGWRLVPLNGLDYVEDDHGTVDADIPYGGGRLGDRLVLVGVASFGNGSAPRAWLADTTG